MVSPQEVRNLLDCDYQTGALTWRYRPSGPKSFNTRFAGKPALTAINKSGYAAGHLNGKYVYAHRVVWCHFYGKWPDDEIDHKKGLSAGNGIANLADVSHQQNGKNTKRRRDNTSGVPGVDFFKPRQKWRAYINHNRKRQYLGYFDTFEEAVAARKAAELKYGFSPNHGRD